MTAKDRKALAKLSPLLAFFVAVWETDGLRMVR
jgi:hypothetical protein